MRSIDELEVSIRNSDFGEFVPLTDRRYKSALETIARKVALPDDTFPCIRSRAHAIDETYEATLEIYEGKRYPTQAILDVLKGEICSTEVEVQVIEKRRVPCIKLKDLRGQSTGLFWSIDNSKNRLY